jgi:hypothetical protein
MFYLFSSVLFIFPFHWCVLSFSLPTSTPTFYDWLYVEGINNRKYFDYVVGDLICENIDLSVGALVRRRLDSIISMNSELIDFSLTED